MGGVKVKIWYENLSDVLVFQLRPGVPIADVREDGGGSSFFYDAEGELVAMEIVDASRRRDLWRPFEHRLDGLVPGGRRRRRRKDFPDDEGNGDVT